MNTPNTSFVADEIATPSESIGNGLSRPLGQPGLLAFTALAASRPEAWDGAEAWPANGPFSSLLMGLPPENSQQAIERAATWEEMADIGSQLLNPWAQKNRGASDDCARVAWEIWAKAQWTVSAAADGAMVSLRKPGAEPNRWTTEDVLVPPTELAQLQWIAAKRLLAALSQPLHFEELSVSMANLRLDLDAEWLAWARQKSPRLLNRNPWPKREDLMRLAGREPNLEEAHSETFKLADLILGQLIAIATEEPLKNPAMRELDARAWRAEQAYLWRQESREGAFWDEISPNSEQTHDAEAQATVDQILPRSEQTLCALGQLAAQTFGLRSVAVYPFGGAHRAKTELIRAFSAFRSLANAANIPRASIGLGGLKLLAGAGFWAIGKKNANGSFLYNDDLGPTSKGLPGGVQLSAPIQPTSLAHEWTHAWDMGLVSRAQRTLPPETAQALAKAEIAVKQAALFKTPVSNPARRAYIRPYKREILRTLTQLFSLERSDLVATLSETGNPTAKTDAQEGRLPRGMAAQIRQIWRQIKIGDDNSVRAALLPVIRHFEHGPGGRALDEWANDLISALAPDTKELRDRLLICQENPNAGRMRWNAILSEQKSGDTGYWTDPMEMLARASQRFFDTIQPVSIYRATLPSGEEAERFNAVLKHFFEAARPAFDAVSATREKNKTVVQLTPPNAESSFFDTISLDAPPLLTAAAQSNGLSGVANLSGRRLALDPAPTAKPAPKAATTRLKPA